MGVSGVLNRITLAKEWVRRFGVQKYIKHIIARIFHIETLDKPVNYQKLMKRSELITANAFEVYEISEQAKLQILEDMTEWKSELASDPKIGNLPNSWDSGLGTQELLFITARLLNAQSVLEIGTGNGVSTKALSHALRIPGKSAHVVSIDIRADCGSSLTTGDLRNIQLKQVGSQLKSRISAIKNLEDKEFDLIFIDGAHDYLNVIVDLELAYSLKPQILIADDIEVNEAWIDFCLSNKVTYKVLLDGRKVIGIIDLNSQNI